MKWKSVNAYSKDTKMRDKRNRSIKKLKVCVNVYQNKEISNINK